MKRLFLVILLFWLFRAQAQERLTLEECYERAEANYPLVKQRALISESASLSVENAYAASRPQIALGAQATYQSDVTRIPFEAPGVRPLSKDQYRVFGEVSQTLYHGGIVAQKASVAEAEHAVEERELEVDLYQLRARINELFFGILLSEDQLAQSTVVRSDLESALRKVEASVSNGTAIPSAADVLKAEMLRTEQRMIEIRSQAETYRNMLSMFIGAPVSADADLEKPAFGTSDTVATRPELLLFDARHRLIENNERALIAAIKPKVDLFVQGGYGRPGLNMLENTFTPYYIGGIRLSWFLSGYYTLTKERQILRIKRQLVESHREVFLFNSQLITGQQEVEIARFQKLLDVDDAIILLRQKIRETAEVQLEQGVISPTDFIREVNAEDAAKQNRMFHQTQLLMAQAKLRFNEGQ